MLTVRIGINRLNNQQRLLVNSRTVSYETGNSSISSAAKALTNTVLINVHRDDALLYSHVITYRRGFDW
jgi:hypothetical protein